MKLCVLGGSSVHTPALIEALGEARLNRFTEISLFGRDSDRLAAIGRFSQERANHHSLPCRVVWSTDIEEAVEGSAIVLNQIRAGGIDAEMEDRRRFAASGIVAHAASFAETLRMTPVLMKLLPVIKVRCPEALFVNFSNPVSTMCELVASETSLKIAGLCYHTTLARHDFAAFLDTNPGRVHIETIGINHLSFITDIVVDKQSRMKELVEYISRHRLREYNHDRVSEAGAIPISHAYSLFSGRERWYVRQLGVRGSVIDAILRISGIDLSGFASKKQRAMFLSRVIERDQSVAVELSTAAPWYRRTIVPFLSDYVVGTGSEHTVTVRKPDFNLPFGGRTAELSCNVRNESIDAAPLGGALGESAREGLRRAVESETQFVHAVRSASFDKAVEALVLHPNVYSRKCAKGFLKHYFPATTST